jgi:hypothetical protein
MTSAQIFPHFAIFRTKTGAEKSGEETATILIHILVLATWVKSDSMERPSSYEKQLNQTHG